MTRTLTDKFSKNSNMPLSKRVAQFQANSYFSGAFVLNPFPCGYCGTRLSRTLLILHVFPPVSESTVPECYDGLTSRHHASDIQMTQDCKPAAGSQVKFHTVWLGKPCRNGSKLQSPVPAALSRGPCVHCRGWVPSGHTVTEQGTSIVW